MGVLTDATERWIAEMAKELGVKPRRLRRIVLRLAKHGVWLDEEDWRFIARVVNLRKRRHLDMVVGYIIRRVSSGATVRQTVGELPAAVERAGKLEHVLEVLRNLLG